MNLALNDQLKREWTDQFVEADTSRPELKRFEASLEEKDVLKPNESPARSIKAIKGIYAQEPICYVVEPAGEKKFMGRIVGRVITVNWNNACLVDFQDGGWYDIAPQFLRKLPEAEADQARKLFNYEMNTARPVPVRQA